MNFKLTATKKTYYIVGGCAAALALAGAALYLPGYYFDFLFTVSAILAGAMFLLVAAAEGTKTPEGKAALVALLLQLVYFSPACRKRWAARWRGPCLRPRTLWRRKKRAITCARFRFW